MSETVVTSGRGRTLEPMQWTVAPGSPREARALAEALDLSETTARVLLRRGYGDAEAARAFLDGISPSHDPRLLDLLAIIVIVITIAAAWFYFIHRTHTTSTAAFIVPSQSVRW